MPPSCGVARSGRRGAPAARARTASLRAPPRDLARVRPRAVQGTPRPLSTLRETSRQPRRKSGAENLLLRQLDRVGDAPQQELARPGIEPSVRRARLAVARLSDRPRIGQISNARPQADHRLRSVAG